MGVEKAELKKAILEDMGIKADDRLDALTAELYRTEGAAKSLKTAAEGIERDVFARLRKELDEGKIDPEEAKHADRYIHTCLNFLSHLAKKTRVQVPIMKGRMDEATYEVQRIKKEHDAEEAKIQAFRAAQAAGEIAEDGDGGHETVSPPSRGPSRRPTGVRPGGSLKAQRQAEGASEAPEEGAGEPAPPPEERGPPPESSPKPRRKPKAVPKTAPAPAPDLPPKAPVKTPKAKTPSETAAAKKAKRQASAKEVAKAKREAAAKAAKKADAKKRAAGRRKR